MSVQVQPINPVPEETVRVARLAFPKGNRYLTLRDEIGTIYTDQDFADLFSPYGQSAISPWRLALICVMQFMEDLTDQSHRQTPGRYVLAPNVLETNKDDRSDTPPAIVLTPATPEQIAFPAFPSSSPF